MDLGTESFLTQEHALSSWLQLLRFLGSHSADSTPNTCSPRSSTPAAACLPSYLMSPFSPSAVGRVVGSCQQPYPVGTLPGLFCCCGQNAPPPKMLAALQIQVPSPSLFLPLHLLWQWQRHQTQHRNCTLTYSCARAAAMGGKDTAGAVVRAMVLSLGGGGEAPVG